MKKNLKKIIGFTIGISALSIVTPIVLASCTNNSVSVDESVAPKQIIDFSKYQEIVYKSNKDDSTTDPFAPIYNGQELYQFQYNLSTNKLDDAAFTKIKEAFSLKEENNNVSPKETATNGKKYFANRDFRNKESITKLLSNLNFTLQTENNDGNKNKTLATSEIDLDVVSNQNLESILGVTEDSNNRRNLTWYVYPKKGKEWDVQNQGTKNAYFSINFIPPKTN